ncbi:MAG: hypothetical protein AAB637_01060 [Patescibacteria group bacterium]
MESTSSGIRTWQWVVTVIVIVILVVLGYYMFKEGKDTGAVIPEETETTTQANDVNRVIVSDQFPGNIVYISSVQLTQPGYVVIHKDNKGVPGDVIGYQYFEKGTYPGKITLTSPTVEKDTYYAMLHSDDGDKKLNAEKDLPLKDASGNIIMKIFKASVNIAEVKG